MNVRNLTLSFCLLFLGLPMAFSLPTTNSKKAIEKTELKSQQKIIAAKKTKKGFFKRIGQNFAVKRIKKMISKHTGLITSVNSSTTTWSQDIAKANDQELKDAKLIGLLCGLLLGLLGVLGVAIFFKKGERKKAALKGAWLGILILVGIVLIASLL